MARRKTKTTKKTPPDPITTLGAIQNLAEMPDQIRELSEGFKKALNAGLSHRLLVLMLTDMTKLSKTQVTKVLEALPLLADRFLDEPE